MRTNFNFLFIYIFLFSLLQTKFAFGQDSLKNAKPDSSAAFKKSMVEDKKDKQIAGKDSIGLKKEGNSFVDKIKNKIEPAGKTDSSKTAETDTVTNKNKHPVHNFKLQQNYTGKLGLQRQNKDSLVKKNNFFGLKNKFPFPQINAKGNFAGAKKDSLAKQDSLSPKNNTKLNPVKSKVASFFKNQLNAIKPQGTVSFGYEYGVLPFVAGNNYPSGGYRTEGKVSLLLLNIPLELSYCYTTIKNVIGFNNYFRISYDANRYKEQLNQQLNVKDQLNQKKLSGLQLDQQKLLQKIEYLNFLKQNPSFKIPVNDSLKNKLTGNFNTSLNLPDSLHPKLPSLPVQGKTDSLKNNNAYSQKEDSLLRELNKYKAKENDIKNDAKEISQKEDSISRELNKYKTEYNNVKNEIKEVEKEIDQVKNVLNNPGTLVSPYLSKVQQFASHIKKFEIGLCSPSYSTFLVSNIPLQGINMEYAANGNFFAFTYGTTVNNLMYNTNTLQGTLQGVRNLYNYFDFGNLSAGRKILSLKGGVGSKDDTHLFVGLLVGKGRTDYLLPINDPSPFTKESNVVMELDGKYKFSKQLSGDMVLGKSSVQEEDLTMEQVKKAVNEILSPFRSYALLTKVNFDVIKTNTKLSFTTRWIDPYFKSFGIGFLRSDNLRYEIKAEQPITRKIKYTIAYRREEDNILKLYDYKNTLQSITNSLNFKISRQFNVRLNYAPLFRELKSPTTIIKDNNQISTVMLSYVPKTKKINAQFNVLYSKYIVNGDSSKINFENFTYSHQLQFTSGFKTGFNASWLRNSLKDTTNNNNVYLAVLDVGYSTKNNSSLTIGGKAACKMASQPQYGFVIKLTIRLYKGLFWESNAEKIIIGDYYNSIIVEQIKKFPYYCNSKFVLNF